MNKLYHHLPWTPVWELSCPSPRTSLSALWALPFGPLGLAATCLPKYLYQNLPMLLTDRMADTNHITNSAEQSAQLYDS